MATSSSAARFLLISGSAQTVTEMLQMILPKGASTLKGCDFSSICCIGKKTCFLMGFGSVITACDRKFKIPHTQEADGGLYSKETTNVVPIYLSMFLLFYGLCFYGFNVSMFLQYKKKMVLCFYGFKLVFIYLSML